jgi:pimeloyl-ACP methyl ester carboxylesterase
MQASLSSCLVDGRTLAFERLGAGPPLIVLNGYAATKADWDPTLIERLGAEHELIRLDNRGLGDSSADGRPFTIEDLAADVAGAIDALGLERPAVLGWSMGGFIALATALAHPEQVGSLVLLSSSPGGPASTPAAAEVKARLRDLSGTPREQASRLISLLFTAERAPEIDAEFGEIVAAARAALPLEVVREQARAIDAWEARGAGARLAEVGCPTLVATGSEDVVIPPANSVALATGIPGAWLARFPRAAHGFMADHPRALARLIGTFLAVEP